MNKIIILSSVGIGDIITLGPLVRKLKKLYPKSIINIYSFKRGHLQKFKINDIDNIIILDNPISVMKLFIEKVDMLIDTGYYPNLYGYLKMIIHHFVILFIRAEKKICNGKLDKQEFKNKNRVEIQLDTLKKINIKLNREDYTLFIPFTFEEEKKQVKEILDKNTIEANIAIVIFHFGTKKDYYTRFWLKNRWIKIINYIRDNYRANICFVGGPDDIGMTNEIINLLDYSVLNLTGKLSIKQTVALISESRLFISTNSGPMWITAALHKPQIALCGPSKLAWNPYNHNAIIIRRVISRKYCTPPCDKKKCIYKDNLCMKTIAVSDVLNAIKKELKDVAKE
jgi:heptosyltransferase III